MIAWRQAADPQRTPRSCSSSWTAWASTPTANTAPSSRKRPRPRLRSARCRGDDRARGAGRCRQERPARGPDTSGSFGYDPERFELGRGTLGARPASTSSCNRATSPPTGNLCTLAVDGTVRRWPSRPAPRRRTGCGRRQVAGRRAPRRNRGVLPPRARAPLLVCSRPRSVPPSPTPTATRGHRTLDPRPLEPDAEAPAQLVTDVAAQARRVLAGESEGERRPAPRLRHASGNLPVRRALGLRAAAVTICRCTGASPGSSAWTCSGGPRRSWRSSRILRDGWGNYDYFFLHHKGTDSAGEDGDHRAPVAAVERLDHRTRTSCPRPRRHRRVSDHSTPTQMAAHPGIRCRRSCGASAAGKTTSNASASNGAGRAGSVSRPRRTSWRSCSPTLVACRSTARNATSARGGAGEFDLQMSDSDALMWNIEKDPLLRSTIVTVLLLDRSPGLGHARRPRSSAAPGSSPACASGSRPRCSASARRTGRPTRTSTSVPPPARAGVRADRSTACSTSPAPRRWPASTAPARCGSTRVVEGLEGGRAAMVLKVHHSMTDGVGGMKLLLMLFDFERDPGPRRAAATGSRRCPCSRRSTSSPSRSTTSGGDAFGIARRGIVDAWARPAAHARRSRRTRTRRRAGSRSVARSWRPATTPRSPIMRARTLARRLGTLDVPLDDLKRAGQGRRRIAQRRVRRRVLGGLQRYHEFHGASVDDLRMVMPINLRDERRRARRQPLHPGALPRPARRSRTRPSGSSRSVALAREIRDEPAVAPDRRAGRRS